MDARDIIAITITEKGVGDGLQFSSLPENYYCATGKKLIDISRPWFFDHNPYVVRDDTHFTNEQIRVLRSSTPEGKYLRLDLKVQEMWNFSPMKYDWPRPREIPVYLSNAEIHAHLLGVEPMLIRPRLYQFEDFPFEKREKILLHLDGKSHGPLKEHIIDFLVRKYKPTGQLYQIGQSDRELGIPKIVTPTLWDLAKVISEARMLLGPDSGPSWVAACYPDVIVKKVRMRNDTEMFRTWIPLNVDNPHSHWDDRCHMIFNPTDDDIGFTMSYRKM